MADPLSITASVIAILGAADSVGKVLSKIRLLNASSDELLALINEVSDFKVVLYDVGRNFRDPSMTNHPVTADQHAHLVDLIDRGKGILLQLEQMIEY